MGEIIRKDASVEDIISDAQKALQNADARGGAWKELADQRIGPVLALFSDADAQFNAARQVAAPLEARLEAENDKADGVLGKVSDEVWNAVGRPGPSCDAAYALLFPGGIAYYADGDPTTQPDRMDVLAQLLVSNVHPKLSTAAAQQAAAEVQSAADALRAAVEAARAPLAQVGVLDRVRIAIGRTTALELASLKRLYKAARFREPEIHAVIPARPRSRAAAKPPRPKVTPERPPAPAAAAPEPPASAGPRSASSPTAPA